MKVASRNKEMMSYATWYEFKKDLEKRFGHGLLNWDWLEVKPKVPLPWDDSHMRATLSVLTSLKTVSNYQVKPQMDTHQVRKVGFCDSHE